MVYIDNDHIASKLTPYDGSNRNGWKALDKGVTWGWDTYATSYYNRTNRKSWKPQDLRCTNFSDMDTLPDDATITDVQVALRIQTDKYYNIPVPSIKFGFVGEKHQNLNNTKNYHDKGWHNGYYVDNDPSFKHYGKHQTPIICDWFINYYYRMPYEELKKGKYNAQSFKDMFLDIRFRDAEVGGTYNYATQVQLAYIYVRIEYVKPNHQIGFVEHFNPYEVRTGDVYQLDAVYTQSEDKAVNGNDITFDLDTTWGTEIISAWTDDSDWDSNSRKWTVNSNGLQEHILHMELKSHCLNTNDVLFDAKPKCSFDYENSIGYGVDDGFDDILFTFDGIVRQYGKACAYISIEGYSSDDEAYYRLRNTKNFKVIGWEVADETPNVAIKSVTRDKQGVYLTVPAEERFKAYLKVCFIPYESGSQTLTFFSNDTGHTATVTFTPSSPIEFHVTNKIETDTYDIAYFYCPENKIKFHEHRILTDIDSFPNTSILPFASNDNDAVMYQGQSTLTLTEWEDLDYIGCVPLEHLHFNPKSTYKDTLLNTTYKNKKYMGKKLAVDEDITLNVRLHPHDVTTIQGLIDMDKPIPINANHKCFEGDALNHRGWAEIYSIKTEETNPHWYKCDIDVKYLTHNLNTRFSIERGNKVNTYPLSDLMRTVFESGDSLSTDENNYFIVRTDGTYNYIPPQIVNGVNIIDKTLRNTFNIHNGQYFNIRSRKTIANITNVAFEWNSAMLSEIKENNISRIVRLKDKDNNSVFEYEYTDYDFHEVNEVVDSVRANVVYRIRTAKGWENVNREITLRTEVDNVGTANSSSSSEAVDVSVDSALLYGSTLHLEVSNNKLKILDEGFNGKEIHTENVIELQGEEYYWECEWKNNNADYESADCKAYLDFIVDETVLSSDLATKFPKCIVSPFPVPKKDLLFTREAEEGTIYYYEDDNEEFSYLVEPYYQYMNGVDIKTVDGISVFNLNYGYNIVYLQNGLVRLGFNRANGDMYLAKYDPKSHTYVDTQTLRLSKYSDINLRSISDDKIEIQASDIIFTMYRGHPYVVIQHPTEDIEITSRFEGVYAEGVGVDASSDYPMYFDLLNNSNLLPDSVGGHNGIDPHSVDVSENSIDRELVNMSWDSSVHFNQVYMGENFDFKVNGSIRNPYTYIELDGSKSLFGEYQFTTEIDDTAPYSLKTYTDDNPIQEGDDEEIYARLSNYHYLGLEGKKIKFYYEYEEGRLVLYGEKTELQESEHSEIYAKLQESDGSAISNATVKFYEDYEIDKVVSYGADNKIEIDDTTELYARARDVDGNGVSGVIVKFYEDYDPTNIG